MGLLVSKAGKVGAKVMKFDPKVRKFGLKVRTFDPKVRKFDPKARTFDPTRLKGKQLLIDLPLERRVLQMPCLICKHFWEHDGWVA